MLNKVDINNLFFKLIIVRHGQSKGNISEVFGGDYSLTDKGHIQSEKVGLLLKNENIDKAFVSPTKRTLETIDLIKKYNNFPVTTTDELKERFYGYMEGKRYSSMDNKQVLEFEKYMALSDEQRLNKRPVKDMETDLELSERIIHFIFSLYSNSIGKTILFVTHGDVIASILNYSKLYKRNELYWGSIDNTAILYLNVFKDNLTIIKTIGIQKVTNI